MIVIGGGISGLAAAHRLGELDSGIAVTLLEAGNRLGGVLETVRQGEFLIERSADNFITQPPWGLELCRRIGFEQELIAPDERLRRALIVRNGRLHRVPDGFLLMAPGKLRSMLASPVLSVAGKIRLLAERLVPRRTDGEDESLADFARRRLGREVFERLVQPLVGGIYAADPEKLSMRATLPRFVEMERRYGSLTRGARRQTDGEGEGITSSGARYGLFVAPRGGMSSLVQRIADRLPAGSARLNAPVEAIERSASGWKISAATPGGSSDQLQCDGVIVATPPDRAAKLVGAVDPTLAELVGQISYAGTAVVSLGYRREQVAHDLDAFGLVVPAVEGRRIIAVSFASQKFPDRAANGAVLLRVFVGGAAQGELVDLPDESLRRLATEELQSLLGAEGEPLCCDIARWPGSMPQYHLGHCALVEKIEARSRALAGLALAGNAYHGVGIPACIRSGEAAAQQVFNSLSTRLTG